MGGRRANYFKAGYTEALSDDTIDALVRAQRSTLSLMSEIHIHHLAGAVARVPDDATAFGERAAPYLINIIGRWVDAASDAAQVDWARDLATAIEPATTGRSYVNFMSVGDDPIQPPTVRPSTSDSPDSRKPGIPSNFFHLNQNIRPAASVLSCSRTGLWGPRPSALRHPPVDS